MLSGCFTAYANKSLTPMWTWPAVASLLPTQGELSPHLGSVVSHTLGILIFHKGEAAISHLGPRSMCSKRLTAQHGASPRLI